MKATRFDRLAWLRGALLASVIPMAAGVPVSAVAQTLYTMADGGRTSDLSVAAASWVSDEFRRGGHLLQINAQYAYARGATGQGVFTGNIDTGVDFSHPEFAGRLTSINVEGVRTITSITTGDRRGERFDLRGDRPSGPAASHGSGSHGLTAAARDGVGMHGVAFNSRAMIANGDLTGEGGIMPWNFRDVAFFEPIYREMTKAGVRIVNQSWNDGAVLSLDQLYGRWSYAPPVSTFGAVGDASLAGGSGNGRTIMVFGTGNYHDSEIAPPPSSFAALPYFRPELEKGWLVATALNGGGDGLADYAVRCGLAKYWCMAGPADGTRTPALDGGYQDYGGTSAAAPVVSGALAVVMERFPYLLNEQARDVLLTTARQLPGESGVSDRTGWGIPDLRKAMDGPGQFLGEFRVTMGEGVSDVWSNDISEDALRQRADENAAARLAWVERQKVGGQGPVPTRERVEADLPTAAQRLQEAINALKAGDVPEAERIVASNVVSTAILELLPFWESRNTSPSEFGDIMELLSSRFDADSYRIAGERLLNRWNDEQAIENRRIASFDLIPTRGSLVKDGAGMLTLTGANTYTGGTTVLGGVLTVGDGGTRGSILGDVRTEAVIAFNRSDAASFAGNVSGSGILVQNGTGTLTLSGANTHAGGTLVSRGTLAATGGAALPDRGTVQIGTGAVLSILADEAVGALAGTGGIDLSASRLAVGADGSSSRFDGAIGGTGGLSKIGGGALFLNGASTYTGTTLLQSGLLSVNGSIASTVQVAAGSRLGGNGRIGGLDVLSGGVLAPGASVGTLTTAGDARFAPGSRYEVEVAADGRMDRLAVGGQAFLGGLQVVVLKEDAGRIFAPGELAGLLGASSEIVTAAGGIVGRLAPTVGTDFLFLGGRLDQSANAVRLTLARNGTAFAAFAGTPNGAAAAAAIDAQPGTALNGAILTSNDAAVLPPLLAALSGEVHASVAGALVDSGSWLRSEALGRAAGDAPDGDAVTLSADGASRTQAYLTGSGLWSDVDGARGTEGFSRSSGGFLAGLGTSVENIWHFGGAAGYTDSSFDFDGLAGSASVDSYQFGLYAGRRFDALRVSAGAGYTRHEISTSRGLQVPGLGLQSLAADYDADMAQVFGEVGYRLGDDALAFEPFANLAYVHLDTDGFSEGSGPAALVSGGYSNDVVFSTLGVDLSSTFDLRGAAVTARGSLGWRHAEGDTTPEARLSFAAGGPGFGVVGSPIAEDALVVEAGFEAAVTQALSFDVSYEGQFGDGTEANGFRAGLNWKF